MADDPKKVRVSGRRGGGGSFKKKAPLDLRVDSRSPGAAGLWEGAAGAASDLGRGFGNGVSDFGDFLTSQRTPTKAGSDVFGPDAPSPKARQGKPSGFGQLGEDLASLGRNLVGREVSEEEEQGKSFADYLAMANELQGGGTDYSALEGQLRNNAAQGDARLEAMYRQLRGSIDADAPAIQQNYDSAGAALNQNSDQAVAATNNAANAARAQQQAQFAALGIDGAAQGVLAAQGGAAGADQAAAVSNIEQNRLANVNQNTANKASAVNYNTGVGNAAGLEGNIQRAALQQALASKLAELQTAASQENAGRSSNALKTALSLQSGDNEARSNASAAEADQRQQDFENQLATQKLVLQQAKAQGSQKTLESTLGSYTQVQKMAEQAGIPVEDLLKQLALARGL